MSISSTFWVLNLHNINAADEDEISQNLWSLGASGLHEDLAFEKKKDGYLPKVLTQEKISLKAYFPDAPSKEALQELKSDFKNIELSLEETPNEDWNEVWKKEWKPFSLCSGFDVFPSWWTDRDPLSPSTQHILEIDPGMAFGTGTHETTQLCAQLICLLDDHGFSVQPSQRILDLGTGTGLLSVVLEKLGYRGLLANDIDRDCYSVFKENLENNQCRHIKWVDDWQKAGPFDLVVANIIDGVLLELSMPLLETLKPNSFVIFSGVLAERKKVFLESLRKIWDFQILVEEEMGDWMGFLLRLKP